MKAINSIQEMVAEGKALEKTGQLPEAAGIYQKVLDDDGTNQVAIARLLVIYRKLKEYGQELRVIDGALAAYDRQSKTLRENWIKAHPKAAGAGKAIFRKLGGAGISTVGANPLVNGLLKRKALVEKRLGSGKKKKQAVVRRMAPKVSIAQRTRQAALETKKAERAAALEQKRQEKEDGKRAAALVRQQAALDNQQTARARQQATEERRRQAEEHPSLFVVSLRYLVALDKIDALMPKHLMFLDKHYKQGDFLVSGRLVPRAGGIIITKGKNRAAVERLMHQDPFVKGKLASIDIVEFSASQVSKVLEKWVKG